jgi:hypothetical protein
VGVLLLVWLGVWLPRLEGPIDLRWDASTYYVLGTSLAEGKGYRLLNEPGEIEAVQYPPLLPLLVAAHQRALGTSDYLEVGTRLRWSYFVLSGAWLLAAYVLARAFLSAPYALAVGAVTGMSFYSFLYPSDALYAEVPFSLVSTLFLLCHQRSHRRGYAVASGMFAAAAYLLRAAGVALLAAWVAESLLRRDFRGAVVRGVVAALPVLLWQGHVRSVAESQSYRRPAYEYQRATYYYSNVTYAENSRLIDPFRPELGRTLPRDFLRRFAANLGAIPASLGESAWMPNTSMPYVLEKLRRWFGIAVPTTWKPSTAEALKLALVIIGLLALAGAVLLAAAGRWFLPLYFGLTVALIALTPWPGQFWRYLAPLTPLTLLFAVHTLLSAASWLVHRWGEGVRRPAFLLVTAPLIGMLLLQAVVTSGFLRNLLPVSYYDADGRESKLRLLTYEPMWHALDPAFEWVRRHSAPGDVVATSVPHLAYIRTRQRAVLPPLEPDPERAGQMLNRVPVSYVVIDRLGLPGISERYAEPVVQREPERWRLVYSNPAGGAWVYERLR